jgi:hypothetical protein
MLHSELFNLWLFAQAIAKLSITIGFLPWLLAAVIVHGRVYKVSGVFPGDFVGKLIDIINVGGTRYLQFLVTDTLRPAPRVFNKCPFPQCIRQEEHGGEHEFPRIRAGAYVEIRADQSRLIEFPGVAKTEAARKAVRR